MKKLKFLKASYAFGLIFLVIGSMAVAQARFDPDNEKSAINWDQLSAKFGSVPPAPANLRIGSIMKFLGNPYWQLL